MAIELKLPSLNRIEYDYVGAIADRELDDSQNQWLALLKKADAENRRVTLLVDGTRSDGMSASQRRLAADFSKKNGALIGRACAAQAVVLVNSIQRGILTAIVWLSPPPCPLKAFATRAEANAYLDEIESGMIARRSA